jgi:hypothetical protein
MLCFALIYTGFTPAAMTGEWCYRMQGLEVQVTVVSPLPARRRQIGDNRIAEGETKNRNRWISSHISWLTDLVYFASQCVVTLHVLTNNQFVCKARGGHLKLWRCWKKNRWLVLSASMWNDVTRKIYRFAIVTLMTTLEAAGRRRAMPPAVFRLSCTSGARIEFSFCLNTALRCESTHSSCDSLQDSYFAWSCNIV